MSSTNLCFFLSLRTPLVLAWSLLNRTFRTSMILLNLSLISWLGPFWSTLLYTSHQPAWSLLSAFLGGCRSFHSVGRTLRVPFEPRSSLTSRHPTRWSFHTLIGPFWTTPCNSFICHPSQHLLTIQLGPRRCSLVGKTGLRRKGYLSTSPLTFLAIFSHFTAWSIFAAITCPCYL